jgi:hypothetical protein
MIRLFALAAVLLGIAACSAPRESRVNAISAPPPPAMMSLRDSFGGVATSSPSW